MWVTTAMVVTTVTVVKRPSGLLPVGRCGRSGGKACVGSEGGETITTAIDAVVSSSGR